MEAKEGIGGDLGAVSITLGRSRFSAAIIGYFKYAKSLFCIYARRLTIGSRSTIVLHFEIFIVFRSHSTNLEYTMDIINYVYIKTTMTSNTKRVIDHSIISLYHANNI